MKIRSLSRCWYEEFCSLGRITPTTVNGVSPRNTCCPTGNSSPNSSFASSLPSTATRLRSATSRSLMNRPPRSAMMLRIRPYAGTMPVTAGVAALTPRRTRALRVMNSGLMCSISATSSAMSCTSSGRSRIGRPSPKPANGLVVRPPKRMTIRSPSPWKRFRVCRSRPTPNASSTTTATVPQAIPSTVREVRSFWARRSVTNSRHTSGDLARRRLDDRVGHLQALQHLDVDGVGETGLDPALLGLARAGAHGHEARVVAVGDEPLRDVEHAIPARDGHLRIGRIARAQRRACHLRQDDLDRKHRRLLLLVRLEPDLLEPALHARVRQGADLDRVLEDVAVDGGADHGLDRFAGGQYRAAFLQRQPLLRQRQLRARLVYLPLCGLEIGGGDEVLVAQLLLAGQLALHVLELDLPQLGAAAELYHFERRRVGGDLEQRLAALDEVPYFGEAPPHHSGQDRFDADLDAGLDGADGEGFIDQGPADDRDGFRPFLLFAAEPSGGGHGAKAEDGEHDGRADDGPALHLEAAPRRVRRMRRVFLLRGSAPLVSRASPPPGARAAAPRRRATGTTSRRR